MNTVISLNDVQSWPSDLLQYLDAHHSVFFGWAADDGRPDASTYDSAVYGLVEALQPFALMGWHCTRLTDAEASKIIDDGMELPNAAMLAERIDALVRGGLMTPAIAANLKANNQAHDQYRAGRVWFCFFPPSIGGESGIGSFFRFWGGEALYRSHDKDPARSKVLQRIGIPSIVEAEVPIALLHPSPGLALKLILRYLIHRGFRSSEPYDHEDRITHPLPPSCVLRIHRFPEPIFLELSGCRAWREPLKG
jgi:hypothetical protein